MVHCVWMLTILSLGPPRLPLVPQTDGSLPADPRQRDILLLDKLGIVIDREMIQNAMLTTATESKHL